MERCCHCKIEKPQSDFHKRANRPSGFHEECKECRKRYFILNRDKYRERSRISMRKYRAKKKEALG